MLTNIKNALFRINRVLHRFLIRHSHNPRPVSSPYISGDSFRTLAHHIYDETTKLNPESVRGGQVVFINGDFLDEFFTHIHHKIAASYILISHNSDKNIDQNCAKYCDEKIKIWFAQNVTVTHSKIIPLPIGLENLHHYNNGIVKIFNKLRKNKRRRKKNRILFGFTIQTNEKARRPAYDKLSTNKLAEQLSGWLNASDYAKVLSGYKFVASPPGNGLDCHRTWEAMYLGVVPIVLRSTATEYFHSLGLPMLVLDDWKELDSFSETDLEDIYSHNQKLFNAQELLMDYWIAQVQQ